MKQFTTSMLMLCLMIQLAFGQSANNNYTVLFKSGAITPAENISEFNSAAKLNSLPLFAGKYYALIQFNAIPTEAQKTQINNAGIQLLSYIPHNAWVASIDQQINVSALASLNIRSIASLTSSQKINEDLKGIDLPDHAQKVKGKIDLIVQFYKNADAAQVQVALQNAGFEILKRGKNLTTYTVRVNLKDGINQLASLPFVQHIQAIDPLPTPDDTKGRGLHRSNVINSDYATGLHYDGTGVTVAVADDGSVSHIDYKGRLTDLTEQGQAGHHGDMTSGICVGAGNLDPVIRGMGTGAHLVLFDIFGSSLGDYPQIVNAVDNYNNHDVVIVSTSYSQGCNEYNNFSQEGDMLLHNNQQLMFCFSAGNANGTDCGYGAGGQWGNVTGGYKQGKNVTTCANVDADGVIDGTSSHGPAADGRVKPDISANGKDQMSLDENNGFQVGGGTSAASPGVGGCYTQLYHAYKSLNGGANPDAALIKACILNTANEIGNPGPDYKFGWGQINVRRAFNTLAVSNYIKDSVAQGIVNNHTITVPAGVARVKVMVYWNDVEGDPAAAKALVNNIDLTITDPSAATLLPLVLDPTPNATTLNANAVPGIDTLNNMEQVTIDAAAAGTYTVNVTGTEIPLGAQSYYVVWEFIMDDITVTYPNGGEGFVPGETELLRWDAYDNTGTFTVEYSTDNGFSYNTASTTVAGGLRQYYWTVPSTVSGDALIRVSRNGVNDVNDTTFTIIGVPQNLNVVYSCPDSIGLQWTAVAGATGYEVSVLGAMYMDAVGTTTTNSFAVTGLNPNDDLWFSVKALGPNGAKGRRALAIQKVPGTFNCLLASDVALSSVASPPQGSYRDCASNAAIPVSIYIKNYSVAPVTTCPVSYTFNGTTYNETFNGSINPYDSALYTFTTTVNLATAGNYNFKSWTGLGTDQNNFNDTTSYSLSVIPGNAAQPPVTEDFQLAFFPPFGYNIVAAGGTYTWEQRIGITGSNGATTTAAYVNNYSYDNQGAEDNLETRVFDLTSATNNAILTFDVAYAAYSATYEDGLRIDISNDCGATFAPSGYLKTGLTLSTIANYNTTAQWAPTSASQWRNDTVLLTPYLGDNIIVRFVNINGYGNSLHLDNINVQQNVPLAISQIDAQQFGVAVYPNPGTGKFYIRDENLSGKDVALKVTDANGRELKSLKVDFNTGKTFLLNLSDYSKGVYFMELRSNDKVYKTKLVVL